MKRPEGFDRLRVPKPSAPAAPAEGADASSRRGRGSRPAAPVTPARTPSGQRSQGPRSVWMWRVVRPWYA
uniref:hypothetical protein n=1 Tax=Clavibacter michiganensis TaxID=28447 RepID=UPI00293158F7